MQCSFPHAVQIKAPDPGELAAEGLRSKVTDWAQNNTISALFRTNELASRGSSFCDNENWEQCNLVRPPLSLVLSPEDGGGSFRAKCGHGNCAEDSPQVGMNQLLLDGENNQFSKKIPNKIYLMFICFPSTRWSSTLTKDESHDDSLGKSWVASGFAHFQRTRIHSSPFRLLSFSFSIVSLPPLRPPPIRGKILPGRWRNMFFSPTALMMMRWATEVLSLQKQFKVKLVWWNPKSSV